MNNIVERTTTGEVVAYNATSPNPARLRSVSLTATAANVLLTVRTGGASGTVVLSLIALVGVSVQWRGDALLANGIHVTLSDVGATTVEWS